MENPALTSVPFLGRHEKGACVQDADGLMIAQLH
jgi:hypothetical protein